MTHMLPVVAPLERALYLRSLDLFRELRAHELVLLAQLMREDWLRRGTVLYEVGQRVRAVHLVVEGTVRCEREGHPPRRVESPDAVGLLELLAGVDAPARAVADTNALALVIDGNAFLDVLDDHFSIVLHVRAALGRQVQALRAQLAPEAIREPAGAIGPRPAAALDLVEQLIWLNRSPELRGFGVSVLASMIGEHGVMRLRPGDVLWKRETEPRFFALIVQGVVAGGGPGREFRAGPGTMVGLEAAFCGVPHADEPTAVTDGLAIRIDVSVLLDLAEDHFHVAARILAYCARRLLQLHDPEIPLITPGRPRGRVEADRHVAAGTPAAVPAPAAGDSGAEADGALAGPPDDTPRRGLIEDRKTDS